MRNRFFGPMIAACLLFTAPVLATEEAQAQKFDLKDGSTLYVQPDGGMRMVDAQGKPISMQDDVEMTLKDGRMIMMKNKYVWITIGPPGKGTAVKTQD